MNVWIPDWVLWCVGLIIFICLLPSYSRNMDGDTLVTWLGRRWLKPRYGDRKWERVK